MQDSEWNHSFSVCSPACGQRLDARLTHKMISRELVDEFLWDIGVAHEQVDRPFFRLGYPAETDRMQDLRIRIKALEHKVREITP